MDWSRCTEVEVVQKNGRFTSVVRGSDLSPDVLLQDFKADKNLEALKTEHPEVSQDRLRSVLEYGLARAAWDVPTLLDWSGCELVEQVPGRCSGAPTIVGTRIFPDTIASAYWAGESVDDILENYPSLTRETIAALVRWVQLNEASAA